MEVITLRGRIANFFLNTKNQYYFLCLPQFCGVILIITYIKFVKEKNFNILFKKFFIRFIIVAILVTSLKLLINSIITDATASLQCGLTLIYTTSVYVGIFLIRLQEKYCILEKSNEQ
jgi:hypothetical protein